MKKILQSFLFLIGITMIVAPLSAQPSSERWILYYADMLPADTFLPYDVIVFDADKHPNLTPLLYRNKTLLAYLSLGEVAPQHAHYAAVEKAGLLMGTNDVWKSRHIDIRNPEWTRMVIEDLIPPLLKEGFNGFMLDTLDTAVALEAQDPKRYAGTREAAVNLVRAIRYHYPEVKLMANRGFEILPQIETDIDMLLAESIFISYDFKTKQFGFVPENIYRGLVVYFNEAKKRAPKLKIYSLDYWKPDDPEGMKKIYAAQRENGLIPYVATSLDLDKLDTETK